ncbi:hypothetical protein SODALDRAFT_379688 [Sodiomyces alkalinus F11]|uniref:Uncharacterized protein n=1 Tax=Sodiomyces alkalinus (strain CBS 110278 / VKM F-3762 / F11) TaxID=1314773 RepID=A0A3N2PRR2_SODAK|nr:hypothetical protein SODALDRAFT_379688 [Sodiomyces alkalinus F11]ROT37211.1 hypothetical protein SODALDRAFT_379688 [Sodiomyces alkalinus F11]
MDNVGGRSALVKCGFQRYPHLSWCWLDSVLDISAEAQIQIQPWTCPTPHLKSSPQGTHTTSDVRPHLFHSAPLPWFVDRPPPHNTLAFRTTQLLLLSHSHSHPLFLSRNATTNSFETIYSTRRTHLIRQRASRHRPPGSPDTDSSSVHSRKPPRYLPQCHDHHHQSRYRRSQLFTMPTHGLHRLERLFSMRKKSSSKLNHGSCGAPEPFEHAENSTTTFPEPPFIRPRGARMEARVESTACSKSANRASSVPEARIDRAPMHSPNPSTASTGDIHGPPTRTVPLRRLGMERKERDMHSAMHFQEFRFPHPRRGTERPPSSPAPSSQSSTTPVPKSFRSQKRNLEHRNSSIVTPVRTDTPPVSDNEDEQRNARGPRDGTMRKMKPAYLAAALPTPETSPEIKPVSDSRTHELRRDSGLHLATNKGGMFCPSRWKLHKAELRKARSQACISSRSERTSGKVLKGGNVKDFFNLSDDDIAEEEEEMEADEQTGGTSHVTQHFLPPSPSETVDGVTTTSASHRNNINSKGFINTLEDAAAYGAVQIAKIAAKHELDLAYIVNLWPENPRYPPPSGCARSSMLGSAEDIVVETETAAGMTGRLLAAYGLSQVASPFCISAAVHTKILRHTSWVEYSAAEAKPGEFSRGYGHAFHAGTAARRAPADPVVEISDTDRGIVFAGYRQFRPDGTTKECTPAGLAALHADVEYLIDMLIVIHKATRLRNPTALVALTHEVGPMPPGTENVFA